MHLAKANQDLMNAERFKTIWTKPPLVFPWVALFHVIMLCYGIWNYKEFPFPSEYWISPLWILLFTVCWLFVCRLKWWAALTYVGLTALAIILQFALEYRSEIDLYTPSFYLVYVLFCLFILAYYKKFSW
jgi:hypothetical protein